MHFPQNELTHDQKKRKKKVELGRSMRTKEMILMSEILSLFQHKILLYLPLRNTKPSCQVNKVGGGGFELFKSRFFSHKQWCKSCYTKLKQSLTALTLQGFIQTNEYAMNHYITDLIKQCNQKIIEACLINDCENWSWFLLWLTIYILLLAE